MISYQGLVLLLSQQNAVIKTNFWKLYDRWCYPTTVLCIWCFVLLIIGKDRWYFDVLWFSKPEIRNSHDSNIPYLKQFKSSKAQYSSICTDQFLFSMSHWRSSYSCRRNYILRPLITPHQRRPTTHIIYCILIACCEINPTKDATCFYIDVRLNAYASTRGTTWMSFFHLDTTSSCGTDKSNKPEYKSNFPGEHTCITYHLSSLHPARPSPRLVSRCRN